jgi:diamine N-acetyltransferase
MRDLGDATELKLDADALARDGFGENPAISGIVAECSGTIVGFLLHHPGYDTDAAARLLFVVDLYVKSTFRGRGIGFALMDAARRVAMESGATQIVWTVDKRNLFARKFYEAIGSSYADNLDLMYMDAQSTCRGLSELF